MNFRTMLDFSLECYALFLVLTELSLTACTRVHPKQQKNVYGVCRQSLTTMRVAPHCPNNRQEWTRRADAMQCWSIKQNCTEQANFVYHCLLNSHWNETVEVCAPRKHITQSYCPEFSVEGLRIQENFDRSCSGEHVACPKFYFSNEIFKYPQCYERTKAPIKEQTPPTNPTLFRSSSDGLKDMFYLKRLCSWLLILLIAAL